ncbi:MAG: Fic family protein [Desulfosarcina sp.]|nr:Fic family protein [Desulfosarcina sp.]MBC2767622.1 Fic family protein [Desulfosarcina sp.]
MYARIDQMTPFFPPENEELTGLALSLIEQSAHLGGVLHPVTSRSIADFLRLTNSYYSNLIEDHNTHPVDIERAMDRDYSDEPAKRALQMEGLAHVEVQEKIEQRLTNESIEVCHPDFISWIHRVFYEKLPDTLRIINDAQERELDMAVPGQFRGRDAQVGNHVAPSHELIRSFLDKFHELYEVNQFKNAVARILAAAASHHRLVWIHPFLDGNGRVARLFTDAYLQRMGLRGAGLWTVSRGLARHKEKYMTMLANADALRRGDLDGRGNLSQAGFVQFCRFFLETCLDQTRFMGRLLELDGLMDRIKGYIVLRSRKMIPGRPPLKVEAGHLLQEALLRGKFARGEAPRITGLAERTARMLVSQMVQERLLVSDTPKGPLKLGIPAHTAEYFFQNLTPRN